MENNEKDFNQQISDQRAIISDLQTRLNSTEDETEKQSLNLKLGVATAKLRELQGEATLANKTEEPAVEEEAPQQKKDFLDTDNNGNTIVQNPEQLDESLPRDYSKSKFLNKDIPEAIKVIERELSFVKQHMRDERNAFALLRGDFEAIEHFAEMVKSNCKDLGNYEDHGTLSESLSSKNHKFKPEELKVGKKVIDKIGGKEIRGTITVNHNDLYGSNPYTPEMKGSTVVTVKRDSDGRSYDVDANDNGGEFIVEGCMSKKFENMTNRELASYIFHHPHTKFGDKMKECDTAEMMKAIRDMKKAKEDVTTTAAVATAPQPSMYMKRPRPEDLED